MTYPTVSVTTTNLDAGADSPATARSDLLDAVQKLNQMIAHTTAFAATLLDDASAAAARATLGAAASGPLVSSGITGAAASGANTDITSVGAITGVTASLSDNTTKLATTAFVNAEIANDVGVANSQLVKTAANASGSAPIYAPRAWVSFSGVSGAINASGNVSSVSRSAVGCYTVNFATAMPDTNYVMSGSAGSGAGTSAVWVNNGSNVGSHTLYNTTSSSRVQTSYTTSNTVDSDVVSVIFLR